MNKRTEMRIVGLNADSVIIQRKRGPRFFEYGGWIQEVISFDKFESLMKDEFPDYLKLYKGKSGYDMADFFFNYVGDDLFNIFIYK